MVSLRRRKLLGFCSGRSSFLAPLSKFPDNGPGSLLQSLKPFSIHPMPYINDQLKEKAALKMDPGLSNASTSSSSKDQPVQQFPEVRRRKKHKRKHFENQEPCVMRGVYFKNLKWQAAIKVDKKQIHLGTVGSQEEAARLYDRAAFMCGREPNFELSEEEKQELGKLKWEEFLTMTRSAITSKRHHKTRAGSQLKSEYSTQNSEEEDEQEGNAVSASDDVEPDTSGS